MKEKNIKPKTKRKFKATTNSKHNYLFADNILNRNFNSTRSNQALVADITYIHTDEGWLYLATVVDLYNRKVVGWAMDSTMTKELVYSAL